MDHERPWKMTQAWEMWSTPDAEEMLLYIARISNPDRQGCGDAKLLKYMLDQKHWSPFTMANWCVGLDSTRDILRQFIRHSSIHVQEFSQRYATIGKLGALQRRSARMKHPKNRQSSLPCEDTFIKDHWLDLQLQVADTALKAYEWALENGVAKEVARAVLPEGMTPSRVYANGNLRNWIHYLQLRTKKGTQLEHRQLAMQIETLFRVRFPIIAEAIFSLPYEQELSTTD